MSLDLIYDADYEKPIKIARYAHNSVQNPKDGS